VYLAVASAMRDSIILIPFRDEIELRIQAGQSQKEIMSWLASKGIIAGRITYAKFCREEGLRRKTTVPATDPALVEAIDHEFHYTSDDNTTIVNRLQTRGIPTTANQVREVRITNNWRQRNETPAEKEH
jgi:hypothetical protein